MFGREQKTGANDNKKKTLIFVAHEMSDVKGAPNFTFVE